MFVSDDTLFNGNSAIQFGYNIVLREQNVTLVISYVDVVRRREQYLMLSE